MLAAAMRGLREAIEVRIRIDGLDAAHARRVMRQVAAGAEADLEDAARRTRQRALARLVEDATAHGEIEQVREDAVMIEAHYRVCGPSNSDGAAQLAGFESGRCVLRIVAGDGRRDFRRERCAVTGEAQRLHRNRTQVTPLHSPRRTEFDESLRRRRRRCRRLRLRRVLTRSHAMTARSRSSGAFAALRTRKAVRPTSAPEDADNRAAICGARVRQTSMAVTGPPCCIACLSSAFSSVSSWSAERAAALVPCRGRLACRRRKRDQHAQTREGSRTHLPVRLQAMRITSLRLATQFIS